MKRLFISIKCNCGKIEEIGWQDGLKSDIQEAIFHCEQCNFVTDFLNATIIKEWRDYKAPLNKFLHFEQLLKEG